MQHQPPEHNDIKFILMTANPTEQATVRHFLGSSSIKQSDTIFPYTYKTDPILCKVKVEPIKDEGDYDIFSINGHRGIHVRCGEIGSGGKIGSHVTTAKILEIARQRKWPLQVVFCVGCCGCSSDKTNLCGYVLLTSHLEDYNRGKMLPDKLHRVPQPYEMSGTWKGYMEEEAITCPDETAEYNEIKYENPEAILSGDFVVKDKTQAEEIRGKKKFVGIEMEGKGIAEAFTIFSKLSCDSFLVVKGVSDYAGSEKSEPAKANWFGKDTELPVSDGERQRIATIQATALVCRTIAKKMH